MKIFGLISHKVNTLGCANAECWVPNYTGTQVSDSLNKPR
ncbi:Acireductone dioxygenase [Nostoc flagelliforme CCNUN1]|uniref:Acireductone dioxygenase n=1 Tax=Nostoc flagelliforme CCNUN1 TaxID=2038116 RepID=A0A2K8SGE9_9NOSO|nr:Acireductone dioxygenase [Nostoc flagelliforme CCNUN1]